MAEHGPEPPSLRPRAGEGFQQHVTVVALGAVGQLLQLPGHGLLVPVGSRQHGRALAVVAVQVGQAGAQAFGGIGELGPGVRIGQDLLGQPVGGAGQVQRLLVGEVPVDGEAGDVGPLPR
jgi:hypothetical protein